MERSDSSVVNFSELASFYLDEVLDSTSKAGIARSLELEKAGDRGEAVALEKYENNDKPGEPEGDSGTGVKDNIPPPESPIEVLDITKKKGRENENNDSSGESARDFNIEAIRIRDR